MDTQTQTETHIQHHKCTQTPQIPLEHLKTTCSRCWWHFRYHRCIPTWTLSLFMLSSEIILAELRKYFHIYSNLQRQSNQKTLIFNERWQFKATKVKEATGDVTVFTNYCITCIGLVSMYVVQFDSHYPLYIQKFGVSGAHWLWQYRTILRKSMGNIKCLITHILQNMP